MCICIYIYMCVCVCLSIPIYLHRQRDVAILHDFAFTLPPFFDLAAFRQVVLKRPAIPLALSRQPDCGRLDQHLLQKPLGLSGHVLIWKIHRWIKV